MRSSARSTNSGRASGWTMQARHAISTPRSAARRRASSRSASATARRSATRRSATRPRPHRHRGARPGRRPPAQRAGDGRCRATRALYHHDAVEVLEHEVADASLDEIRIYFPDPWHKKRHNKRRLVNPDFAALLVRKLARGWPLAPRHRLAGLCGADVGRAGCDPRHRQSRRRARRGAATGLAAADPFRDPRPEARPRRLGSAVRPLLTMLYRSHGQGTARRRNGHHADAHHRHGARARDWWSSRW